MSVQNINAKSQTEKQIDKKIFRYPFRWWRSA